MCPSSVLFVCLAFYKIVITSSSTCGTLIRNANTQHVQTLTSPNYPGLYPQSITCKWTINAPYSKLVQLTFIAFDTYGYPTCGLSTDDTLKIYDADYEHNMIGKYCGNYLPANVVSSGCSLHLVFESLRYYSANKGFKLEYRAVNNPTDDKSICSPFNSESNNKYITKVATTTTKYIKSPLYPNKYPSNIECVWYITASGSNKIKLTLKNVKIYNYYYGSACYPGIDVLTVIDGPYMNSSKLKTVCSPSTYPSTTVTSSGSHMIISFKSNLDNYLRRSTAGFLAEYTEIEWSSTCGALNLDANTQYAQTLTSPNYPGFYPQSTKCNWTINAPYKKLLQLTFTAFDTNGNQTCGLSTDDTLKIYDASYGHNMIGKYCGNYLPANVVSSGGSLHLVFNSQRYNIGNKGFKLEYKAVDNPIDDETICSPFNSESNNKNIRKRATSTTTRYIESPLYPNKYPSNIECVWHITAFPKSKKIKLTLKNITIFNYKNDSSCSSGNDVLTVRDGEFTNSKELVTICTPTSSSTTVISSGSSMTIRFKSNLDNYFSGSTAGFQAEYIAIEDSSNTFGVVIAVIIGVIMLIGLIVCCVFVARKRGNQGYQRTPAAASMQTPTTEPQNHMELQVNLPPPPSGNYPPPVQVNDPQGQANYPAPGQANYPAPGQTSYPPATQGNGYPQDEVAGGYAPPLQGSPYSVPSDPPPPYPGPPAYPPQQNTLPPYPGPPQQNTPYNPQATAQPNPPYPPT